MSFNPEQYKKSFEDAPADYGDDGSCLPRGWYPVRIFPVKMDETQNGVPRVLVSCAVTAGPKAGRSFLQEFYLKASTVERKKDEDTGEYYDVARDEATIEKKNNNLKYRMKGFMEAAGIEPDFTANSRDENDFLLQYFNVEGWKNARVMANVDIQKERNRVKGWASLDHEKYGLAAFEERLAKQDTQARAASSV